MPPKPTKLKQVFPPSVPRTVQFPPIAPDSFAFTFRVEPLTSLLGCNPFLTSTGKPIYRRSPRNKKDQALDIDSATKYILQNGLYQGEVPVEIRQCLRAILRFENGVRLKAAEGLSRVSHEDVCFYAVPQSSRQAIVSLESENDSWKCELVFGYGEDCLTLIVNQDGRMTPVEPATLRSRNFEAGRECNVMPGLWHMVTPENVMVARLIVLHRAYEVLITPEHTPQKRKAADLGKEASPKRRRHNDDTQSEYTLTNTAAVDESDPSDGSYVLSNYAYPRFDSGDSLSLRPRYGAFEQNETSDLVRADTESYQMRTVQRVISWRTDVVHVKHCHNGTIVAKLVQRENTLGNARRFESEVAIMKRLNHPNIVKFVAQDARILSIYMKLAPGRDLSCWQSGNIFSESTDVAQAIASKMAAALSYVHSQGISHNDIKTGNIVYDPDRGPTLIDFGHATNMGDVPVGGSPAYIPPEMELDTVCSGDRDVYAFGIVMLYLLGVVPVPDKMPESMYNIKLALANKQSDDGQMRADLVLFVNKIRRQELYRFGELGETVDRMLSEKDRPTAADVCTLFDGLTLEEQPKPLLEYH